jgi:hypothetical protein
LGPDYLFSIFKKKEKTFDEGAMETTPKDLIRLIAFRLDVVSVVRFSQTCKRFFEVLRKLPVLKKWRTLWSGEREELLYEVCKLETSARRHLLGVLAFSPTFSTHFREKKLHKAAIRGLAAGGRDGNQAVLDLIGGYRDWSAHDMLPYFPHIVEGCCESDNVELVETIMRKGMLPLYAWDSNLNNAFQVAISAGKRAIAELLLEKDFKKQISFPGAVGRACRSADPEVLQWVLDKGAVVKLDLFGDEVAEGLGHSGNIDCFQIMEKFPGIIDRFKVFQAACYSQSKIDVCEGMIRLVAEQIEVENKMDEFTNALCFLWLKDSSSGKSVFRSVMQTCFLIIPMAFESFCKQHRPKVCEIVRFLNLNFEEQIPDSSLQVAFQNAAKNGNLSTLKYLKNLERLSVTRALSDAAFLGACKENQIDCVTFLVGECGARKYYEGLEASTDLDIRRYLKNLLREGNSGGHKNLSKRHGKKKQNHRR